MLSSINKCMTSRDKEGTISLYSAFVLTQHHTHTWNTVLSFTLQKLLFKKYVGRLRELCVFSLEKGKHRGDPIIMFHHLQGGYQEDGDSLFYKKSQTDKRLRIQVTAGEILIGQKKKKNCQLKQSALGIIFAGKWWIPQGWIVLIFSRTDYWAIFSGLRFCQERLYWMILEVPSNLVFYYSIFYGLNKKCDINGLYIYLGR